MKKELIFVMMAATSADTFACSAPTASTSVASAAPATSTTTADGTTMNPNSTTTATRTWTLELTSDGGFSGAGNGGLTVAGNAITGHRRGHDCALLLDDAEQKSLAAVIAAIHPETWKSEYAPAAHPHGHPDEFHFNLTVRDAAGKSYTTSWYGEGAEEQRLPPDLDQLRETLLPLQQRAVAGCN